MQHMYSIHSKHDITHLCNNYTKQPTQHNILWGVKAFSASNMFTSVLYMYQIS